MGQVIGQRRTSTKEAQQDVRISRAEDVQARTTSGGLIDDIAFGLPGRVKAEENIQKRAPAKDFLDDMNKLKPESFLGAVGKTAGQAAAGLGLASERIQGAIVGPLFESQDPQGDDLIKRMLTASSEGATGKRPVQLSDLYRSRVPDVKIGDVDISNAVSIIGGLATEIGIGAGFVKNVRSLLKSNPNRIKTIEKSLELADNVKNEAGKALSKYFKSSSGQKTIRPRVIKSAVDKLPERAMKKIKGDFQSYGVVFDKVKGTGREVVNESAENIWRFRQALDDLLTSKDFYGETTNLTRRAIKRSAGQLRKALGNIDKRIQPLMDKYSNYADILTDSRHMLTTKGKGVLNKAANIMKRRGEPASQETLRRYASLFPKGASMLRDIKSLNTIRAIDDSKELIARVAVGTSVAAPIIKKAFGPIRDLVGGSSSDSGVVKG